MNNEVINCESQTARSREITKVDEFVKMFCTYRYFYLKIYSCISLYKCTKIKIGNKFAYVPCKYTEIR